MGRSQVEEAKLKERQAAAAAAADEKAGGCARKASSGEVSAAVQVQNGEGDTLSISSSVVQVRWYPDTKTFGGWALIRSSNLASIYPGTLSHPDS